MKPLAAAACLAFFATSAIAAPKDDAQYIVDQSVTEQIYEAPVLAQQTYISAAVSHQLAQQGIEVSDMPAFMGIIVAEMLESFTDGMKTEMTTFYLENFSPQELSDLASFYATPTGQSFLAKQPEMISFSSTAGTQVARAVQQGLLSAVAARLKSENIEIGQPGTSARFIEQFQ